MRNLEKDSGFRLLDRLRPSMMRRSGRLESIQNGQLVSERDDFQMQ